MEFTVEKVSNMIFITADDVVFKAWEKSEFTERKLNSVMKKLTNQYKGNATFEKHSKYEYFDLLVGNIKNY